MGNIFEKIGRVVEFGNLEDTEDETGINAKGVVFLVDKKYHLALIGISEEKLSEMPNIYGKKIKVTLELISD